MDAVFFIILFLAVAAGFFFGRRSNPRLSPHHTNRHPSVHHGYVEGLKHLLNERPDAAIDALVMDLEISPDTLELYGSLGALWRKRGEMERAIRVHQTLLESAALTSVQRQQVQLELALDYSHSGVLDRGEVLLKELVTDAGSAIQQSAGRELVLLYQEEREWEKAIAAVDEICGQAEMPDAAFWRHLQGHYYCELAERALGGIDWNESSLLSNGISAGADVDRAHELLSRAERHVPKHPRLLLLQSLIALGKGDRVGANDTLRQLELIPDYSMVLVPLLIAVGGGDYGAVDDGLKDFYRHSHDLAVLPYVGDLLSRKNGGNVAIDFLIEELRAEDGMAPFANLLATMDAASFDYQKLSPALKEMLPFQFTCNHCGFLGRKFYWCCPSCKTWL